MFFGCFRLLCAVYIFHIVVVSSCCPVGFVCLKLLSFLVSGAFLSFVVFVVFGCSGLFETVSRLIEECFVKSILELVQM